jgi:hypothetical protein
MTAPRSFRHKKRRYHRPAAALGHVTAGDDPSAVSRAGLLRTGIVLCALAAPFALAYAMALILGPVNTQRWLASAHAEWLAPWLK